MSLKLWIVAFPRWAFGTFDREEAKIDRARCDALQEGMFHCCPRRADQPARPRIVEKIEKPVRNRKRTLPDGSRQS